VIPDGSTERLCSRLARIPLRCVDMILGCLVLPGIAASQSATVTDPPGFHFVLRLEGDKTTYKLGEAIHLEMSCNSDLSQRYSSTCGDDTAALFTDHAGAPFT
jgi:hypothetical protein